MFDSYSLCRKLGIQSPGATIMTFPHSVIESLGGIDDADGLYVLHKGFQDSWRVAALIFQLLADMEKREILVLEGRGHFILEVLRVQELAGYI